MNANPLAVAFREVRHFQPDDCLHLEPIAVRGRLHAWTIPAHRHDGLHQFQWLQQGRADATLDGRTLAIEAPAALMIAPRCVHGFVYSPHTQGQQLSVPTRLLAQSLAEAPALAVGLEASKVAADIGVEDRAELDSMFCRLGTEFERDAPGRVEALKSMAVLLALWFLRRVDAGPPGARSAGVRDTLVQRFRTLTQRHYREHRPVSFYAEMLKVTPDHLSRACRDVAGLSALDLLHERVLAEARRLLSVSELPVTEIAAALGYDDAQYFSRFFARRVGTARHRVGTASAPPRDVRQRRRATADRRGESPNSSEADPVRRRRPHRCTRQQRAVVEDDLCIRIRIHRINLRIAAHEQPQPCSSPRHRRRSPRRITFPGLQAHGHRGGRCCRAGGCIGA